MARLHAVESRNDTKIAARLIERLQAYGHKISIDTTYLVPGVEWNQSLREAVRGADGLLAILSRSSIDTTTHRITSQWIAADIGAARASGKFVIPVLVGETCPIPTLIDDIFAIWWKDPNDPAELRKIAAQVSDAIAKHVDRRSREVGLDLPPGYQHLASSVLRYREDTPYQKSVFVMMKFPNEKTMQPRELRLLADIWDTLQEEASKYHLTARRADQRTYEDQLWENLCVYMLSSRYGIAILEDRVARELNPNIALEYGFMKAFNRSVGLFRDVNFKHDRADLTGKLATPFVISKNGVLEKRSLREAVARWATDLDLVPARKRRRRGP